MSTREKVRRCKAPWPFLWTADDKGVLLRNVQPKVKPPKLAKLKRIPPSSQWQQEALL